ncbi:MAG: flavodoxin family protein [Candidatus Hodarchaeota archaeon]
MNLTRKIIMKTILLHGSPRKSGNTDTLAEHFIKGLRKSGHRDVKDFYTNDINVKPCQMCESCGRSVDNSCAIKDDMQEIYSAFRDANVVVWAVPMLWGYMTAQLKTVLDRMEALAMDPEKYFTGKTYVVIIAYRYHYESTLAFFKRITKYYSINLHTIIYCCEDEDSGEDIHVACCKEKLEEAYELGVSLGKNSS